MEVETPSKSGVENSRRSFHLLPHQRKLAGEVLADLRAGKDEVLLAACPGFGKTEVAIWLVRELLREGRVKRALVSAHGTRVLRSNFEDRLRLRAPDLLSSGKVKVVLPHQWESVEGRFDLVVVDEAHEFYEVDGGMVERLIKRVGAKQVLLATGTPSPFIRRGLKPHAFALRELMEAGWASDVQVVLARSAYRVKESDWNEDGDLKTALRLPPKATEQTLGDVVADLRGRVDLAKGKTIIACRDVEMARQVSKCLKRTSTQHTVSDHEEDPDSLNVRSFRGGACPVLVVVRRATLGFDMPTLSAFIDVTCSRNPDRIFQMCCRLVRKTEAGSRKIFVKVMPEVFAGVELQHFMTGVMMLGDHDVYTSWKGRPLGALTIGVRTPSEGEGEEGQRWKPLLAREMMSFGNLFAATEAGSTATTSLGRVLGRRPLEIEIDGRSQTTGQWEREYGLRTGIVLERWKRGYRGRRLIAPSGERTLEIDGRVQSITAWSSESGVPRSLIQSRLYEGKRGMELLAPRQRAVPIAIGKRSLTLQQWAAKTGIDVLLLRTRFSRGVRGQALLGPPSPNRLQITVGSRTQSGQAWARETGLSASTILYRWNRGYRGKRLLAPVGGLAR
jgi:superfamily II DNA or RNA helicase